MGQLISNAALLAFMGGGIAVTANLFWNFRSAKAARKIPFLQRQLELSFEASQTVAILATTTSPETWEKARERFWQLYYGPLAIIEDVAVKKTMIQCRAFVPETGLPASLPLTLLQQPSLDLSHDIRRLLLKTWDIKSLEPDLEGYESVAEITRRTYFEELKRQTEKRQ